MKTRLLILIAVFIFVGLITFIVLIYSINLVIKLPEFQEYIGGGAIDLDPDLSPSYAYDFTGYFQFHSIFVIVPIMIWITSLAFLVPIIIWRKKNESRN